METLTDLIGTKAPAAAITAANTTTGNDGIFVWIFLGFLAMIVVGQLVPAIMLIVGMAKGITSRVKAKTKAQ